MNKQMTLRDALHHSVGSLNSLMVQAHEKFNSEFNIQLVKDGATGLYLLSVEVVDDSKL